MKTHPAHTDPNEPIRQWASELRALVVEELAPERVEALTATALGASLTTAAALAAAQGGITMTTASIGATAASSVTAKIAAGGLAATLAVGGSLAVTGSLPDTAQELSADVAARIGITLPRPGIEASVRGTLGALAGTIVDVAGAGHVGVRVENDRLVLTGIEANGAFTGHVVSQTADSIIVEFRSAAETATVLLANVGGTVASSVTTKTHASGAADVGGSAQVGGSGKIGVGMQGSAGISGSARGSAGAGSGSAEAEAEAEADIQADVEVGGSAGTGSGSAEAEAEAEIEIRIGG